MRAIIALIGGALLLSACANSPYTVVAGGPSPSQLSGDLFDCRRAAFHQYYGGAQGQASIWGGLLGGPVGSLIGGGIGAAASSDEDMRPSDIHDVVNRCMAARGYASTEH